MGWSDFVGKPFTREEFADYVDKLTWTPKVWNPEKPQMPKGIVLHNTAAPTLAQWVESGPKHEARIRNLRDYYENTQKWHGGPHLFISRDWINIFDGLLEHGTHSPSFTRPISASKWSAITTAKHSIPAMAPRFGTTPSLRRPCCA
jgi:hypothetical protein